MVFSHEIIGCKPVAQPSRSWTQARLRKEAKTQEIWLKFKSGEKPQGCTTKSTLLVIENQHLKEKKEKSPFCHLFCHYSTLFHIISSNARIHKVFILS